MKIPLIKPYIDDEIRALVNKVLDSGYLTEGNVTYDLEAMVGSYVGCRHAIAFTSCTTGLETALRCIGISPGDEVIVPDYTYPATSAVAPMLGAISVIVDVDQDTMLIDYNEIEKAITSRTKAIIPVSLFGNPLDYDRLNFIKNKYNVYIIEDAACSLGAEWGGAMAGKQADISVFSFHPRKFITTGEGGMLTTDNDEWADWINSYKHFGIGTSGTRESIVFEITGTNYKLSNVLAAIGLGQMRKINMLLERRRDLAAKYKELIGNNPGIKLPAITIKGLHSFQTYSVFVENRDYILRKMRAAEIEVQIGTYSLHMHPAFQNNPLVRLSGNYDNSRWVYKHCLALPLFNDLTKEQQEEVVRELKGLI